MKEIFELLIILQQLFSFETTATFDKPGFFPQSILEKLEALALVSGEI